MVPATLQLALLTWGSWSLPYAAVVIFTWYRLSERGVVYYLFLLEIFDSLLVILCLGVKSTIIPRMPQITAAGFQTWRLKIE